MRWRLSHRFDPRALPIADRHYNRQKVGSPQFAPPGRCVVLLTPDADALWVTSWPFAEYVKHQWAGAWMCSCFRNESPMLASELIRDAVAVTRWVYGEPPALGMVTFIDRRKVRRSRVYGYTYRRAGFVECGETRGGLLALQLHPEAMPEPRAPLRSHEDKDLPTQIDMLAVTPLFSTLSEKGSR
jgi:hypothetical protein